MKITAIRADKTTVIAYLYRIGNYIMPLPQTDITLVMDDLTKMMEMTDHSLQFHPIWWRKFSFIWKLAALLMNNRIKKKIDEIQYMPLNIPMTMCSLPYWGYIIYIGSLIWSIYHQTFNTRYTKSCLFMQLSLPNPLKPCVENDMSLPIMVWLILEIWEYL